MMCVLCLSLTGLMFLVLTNALLTAVSCFEHVYTHTCSVPTYVCTHAYMICTHTCIHTQSAVFPMVNY